jgi:hypothetical protein
MDNVICVINYYKNLFKEYAKYARSLIRYRLSIILNDNKPNYLRYISTLALLFNVSRFLDALIKRFRIRLQRPSADII